jgi:hypothetical protein
MAPAGLSTSESSLPRFFTPFRSSAALTARMTTSAPGSFVGRKLQLLAPVLGRERAARPRRNRVHDVVYRVPAGEERGLVGGSGLRHTEMNVAVAEMAEAGDTRTRVDRLACPRQALRARRNSSRFACTSASTRRNRATNNHGSTARVERADDSVEVLSRGPKSAVEARNEVASILRYRLG